jgi:hypothetical protein
MEAPKSLNITQSIAQGSSAAAAAYPISVMINNRSTMGFKKAEVAVKDNDSNQVVTARFGRIEAGASARETVTLPGGIEWCVFRITPDVGEDILGGGAASNAPGVEITIED